MARKRGNHEGTIYKLPSGGWCAQITLEGQRVSRSFDTHREGLVWIRKTQGQIDIGMMAASANITVETYLGEWLQSERALVVRNTWQHYESLLRLYIQPNLGRIKLRELRTEHIQALYNRLLRAKVGIPTIRKIHVLLHGALQQAMKIGMVGRNPVSFARPPKEVVKEMAILDEQQLNQLMLAAQTHRWGPLFHLAVVTGARQMELLGLKWADVDWANRTLRIERQLVRPGGEGVEFSAPKTRHGKRTIPLGNRTLDVLRGHYQDQQAMRVAAWPDWQDYDLIFTTRLGTPIDHRNVLRTFKNLLQESGLPSVRFHDIRHSTASMLLNQGMPVLTVSRYLGHARASITLDTYGHLLPGFHLGMGEKIDELLIPVAVDLEAIRVNP